MAREFQVETAQGPSRSGKPGDYLVRTEDGELWPIDKEVFEKAYRSDKKWHAPKLKYTGNTVEDFEMLNLIKGLTALGQVHRALQASIVKETQ